MRSRTIYVIAALLAISSLACENNQAPVDDGGEIVLRFAPAAASRTPAMAASVFDSVVVNVYRSGTPLRLEVSRGVAITTDDPITLPIACIAENNKHVAVDLYASHLLVYHGSTSNVDVVPNQTTPVSVDVSAFYISNLTITPGVIPDGAAFTLHWPPAPAATSYRLEESATIDFAVIASSQSVADTTIDVHVPTGSHFFRVLPVTAYAEGLPSGPRFGYVTGGSGQVTVSSVDAAVIPGETITITGENLDFPGTQVTIGSREMMIESIAWDQIVARASRYATTGTVSVTSALGSDTSDQAVVVQRVAYVTSTGEFAASYIDLLSRHADDFGWSGVAEIPVTQLDTRDMSVFDIIVVANDTGDSPIRWADKATRYAAITTSGAGVLAIGQGGANFLRLAVNDLSSVATNGALLTSYYLTSPTAAIFTKPHTVTNSLLPISVKFCANPENTVYFAIGGNKPADSNDYAETGALSNKWVIADFQVSSLRYVYFGFAADPSGLTSGGQDFVGNAMSLLYSDRPPLPADPGAAAR